MRKTYIHHPPHLRANKFKIAYHLILTPHVDLDIQATNILFRSLHDCILCEVMNMKTAHEILSYLNETYGAASDDDKPKEGVHGDDEHIHDMVIVEDCSTSWTSDDDDDDQSTTSSLDKVDDDDSSVANNDSTPSTIDGQVDSCTPSLGLSSSLEAAT